jgi:hypothetical protein
MTRKFSFRVEEFQSQRRIAGHAIDTSAIPETKNQHEGSEDSAMRSRLQSIQVFMREVCATPTDGD